MQIHPISMMLMTSLFITNSIQAQENSTTTINANNLSKHLSTIILPEPIKRVQPKYPINAARSRREGWARLSFVIDKEGNVSDVLVNETSGSIDFAKEAVRAVKKWKYKPAYENGKPIQQCVNSVQMDFKMNKNGTTGATRKFISKYKKAQKALTTKDYDEVEIQIALMKKSKYMHLSENNYMHLLAADYAKAKGDKELRLFHLRRVRSIKGDNNEKQKLATLYTMLSLELELNEFRAAHGSYNRLIKLEAAKPYLAKLAETMAKVDEFIGGDQHLVRSADIVDHDFWSAALVRKEFSLTDVEGSLHTLDVRCANKRHVYTIGKNSTWKLPTSWENCSIYVFGEPNTQFKLIEHPLKS